MEFSALKSLSSQIRDIKPIKIACEFSSVDEADEFKNFAKYNKFFSDTYISKAWAKGVEFNSVDATKGKSIEFIKKRF